MIFLLSVACTAPPGPTPSAPPTPGSDHVNLVWITIDTLRADRTQPYGGPPGLTRALAAFAQTATVFGEARSNAPWTKPSVSTLVTSTLPAVHGVFEWQDALDEDQPTLALALDAAGYDTRAHIATSAMDPESNLFHPGFDVFDISSWETRGYPGDIVTSPWLVPGALDSLAEVEPPFFVWVHFMDPHNDYLTHEEWPVGDSALDRYEGEIGFTDMYIGQILDAVDALPQETVVVVAADHGECFGEHDHYGHGRAVWDELLRVPLMIRAPGVAPGRVDRRVGLIDVAPTVLDRMGIEAPTTFDGEAIPVVDGRFVVADDRRVIAETRYQSDVLAVFEGPHKVVRDRVAGTERLFDLSADPTEQVDLSASEPGIAAELGAILDEYELGRDP